MLVGIRVEVPSHKVCVTLLLFPVPNLGAASGADTCPSPGHPLHSACTPPCLQGLPTANEACNICNISHSTCSQLPPAPVFCTYCKGQPRSWRYAAFPTRLSLSPLFLHSLLSLPAELFMPQEVSGFKTISCSFTGHLCFPLALQPAVSWGSQGGDGQCVTLRDTSTGKGQGLWICGVKRGRAKSQNACVTCRSQGQELGLAAQVFPLPVTHLLTFFGCPVGLEGVEGEAKELPHGVSRGV